MDTFRITMKISAARSFVFGEIQMKLSLLKEIIQEIVDETLQEARKTWERSQESLLEGISSR